MAQLFTMPQLGSTMEEGTIVAWRRREGEAVNEGDVLLEIETDKATMEVDSPATGILRRILVPKDSVVAIRRPIAIIAGADESIAELLATAGGDGQSAGNGSLAVSAGTNGAVAAAEVGKSVEASAASPASGGVPVFLSPRARRVADEHGVAVAALAGRGTGADGRVVERDVFAFLREQPVVAPALERAATRTTPLAARMADDLGIDIGDLATGLPGSRVRSADVLRHADASRPVASATPPTEAWTSEPFGGMRKRIAENVARSAFSAPHVTLTMEVDMTACGELRAKVIPDVEATYGARLSFTDILVKATARALAEHPRINSGLVGDEVRTYTQRNVGVAVALEEGLIVPVVRDADQKSLGAISVELKTLVDRARKGKFTPDDLAGGTFTISNLGGFGIDLFDPIIVPGQAAILGVGRIVEKPAVVGGAIVPRSMMNLCLSFDHRVMDGAPAARFLQRLRELLENPIRILI